MSFERFTDRARKTFQLALLEAQLHGCESVDTPHLLLGILREGSGVACNILRKLGVDMDRFLLQVRDSLSCSDRVTSGRLPSTPQHRKVLEVAVSLSQTFNHNYVGTEHLLLALTLQQVSPIAGDLVFNFLYTWGVWFSKVRDAILEMTRAQVSGEELEKSPEEMSTRILHLTPNLSVLVPTPPKKVKLEKPPEEMNYEMVEPPVCPVKIFNTAQMAVSVEREEFVRALWHRVSQGLEFNWGMSEQTFCQHALWDLEEVGHCYVWRRDKGSFQGLWILNPTCLFPTSEEYYVVDHESPHSFYIRSQEVEKITRSSTPTLEEVIASLTPEQKQDILSQLVMGRRISPVEIRERVLGDKGLPSGVGCLSFHTSTGEGGKISTTAVFSIPAGLPSSVLVDVYKWLSRNAPLLRGFKRTASKWTEQKKGGVITWEALDEPISSQGGI